MLGKTVAVFKDTLAESNETIDRLSSPIRAAEGSTREIHLALDRVRGEIEVLAQWLNQASKPLRSGLADVDDRADLGAFDFARRTLEFVERSAPRPRLRAELAALEQQIATVNGPSTAEQAIDDWVSVLTRPDQLHEILQRTDPGAFSAAELRRAAAWCRDRWEETDSCSAPLFA